MADWKVTYLAALTTRDIAEKAHQDIYDAYTKLADRTSSLSRPQLAPPPEEPPTSPPPSIVQRFSAKSPSPAPPTETPSSAALRAEFTTAQADRAKLSTQLEAALSELVTLKDASKTDRKEINKLTKTVTQIQVRLRDRDEELRGKAKLLEDVQDENATLNLELKQADEQAKKLRRENQELVDRWMEAKGEEAERMNSEGKFR
jgi:DNA repair exonuclease SbcCD ATPase subunit